MIENILKQDEYILNKFLSKKSLYRDIYNEFESDFKTIWIVWLRWVWKTSYLLSKRKNDKNWIYISCDTLEFKNANLFGIIDELRKSYNYNTFYLDEIHYNSNWEQSLKNIYDFLDVKIIFSGSNMINLSKWSYDLSRRVIKFELKEFSFREYILLTKWIKIDDYSLDNIINNHIEIAKNNINWYSKKLLSDYFEVWQFGYYYEDIGNFIEYKLKLQNSIKKSIFEDLSEFVDISTSNLSKIEDILYYIAWAWTSDLSVYAISKKVNLSPQTIEIYLNFLSSIWLINIVDYFWNLSEKLRKTKKFFFSNNNLLNLYESYIWNNRETFFISQFKRFWLNLQFQTNTDFVLKWSENTWFFEIWWKNKKRLENNIFVVKDDIEIWKWNEIPLWLFGLIN